MTKQSNFSKFKYLPAHAAYFAFNLALQARRMWWSILLPVECKRSNASQSADTKVWHTVRHSLWSNSSGLVERLSSTENYMKFEIN
jgi:hypothetical protein